MKVRCGVGLIEAISKLGEQRVEVQLPEASIERCSLELFDEIAVCVVEVVHQFANNPQRGTVSVAGCEVLEVLMSPCSIRHRCEEVHYRALLIALMEMLRRVRQQLVQAFIEPFSGGVLRLEVNRQGECPKTSLGVASENGRNVVEIADVE
jgi:hypothetical protein